MKVIIPGGSGHVGSAISRFFSRRGDEVVILSRRSDGNHVFWDGETIGPWVNEIEGADVVVNLAGRTVNCRYTKENLTEMMESRVRSARVVGEAINLCVNPPKVWLQSSTATIYRHSIDQANDDHTGVLGGDEPNTPFKWNASIAIAKAWEKELEVANTPSTRKVALRSAMTMSPDPSSVFEVFSSLAKRGLSGRLGSGKQYVSWIHEHDFVHAIDFIINNEGIEGPINLSSPNPLPQHEFAKIMREIHGIKFGLPAFPWMVELGTILMRTESELVLKSRRVIPSRLIEAGFEFQYPEWSNAARELKSRLGQPL